MKDIFGQFVNRITDKLEADSRFIGLAVEGSWVRDEIDEYSDLDLIIICESDSPPEAPDMQSFARDLGVNISSFTGEHVGEPALLICLFGDPLVHIDLKFSTLADLRNRPYDPKVVWERRSVVSDTIAESQATPMVPDAQWIEDRFWTWIHYGALRLGRGELFELIGFLGFLRERVLGPLALHASGFPPFGVRKIERYIPEFAVRLENTIPAYDLASCHSAMLASVEIYKDLRGGFSEQVTKNEIAEAECMRYVNHVASEVIT